MERSTSGGARVERDRARRTKKEEEALTTTSSAIANCEGRVGIALVAATTAGFTASFQNGHGDGRTKDRVPESAIGCSAMQ